MRDSVYLDWGYPKTCGAPTFEAAFRLGDAVRLIGTERIGQVLQRAFYHGQYRYYVMFVGAVMPEWQWEGFMRGVR
jgi:hypothetical protein